jgi:8-oxo-dGTP diphosphatase
MSKTIVTAVLGALIIDDKIVLVKRSDIPVWVLPGGKIDPNETAEEAIVRETKEETGYDVKIERKIALYSSSSPFLTPVFLFALSPLSLEPSAFDTTESKEVALFSPQDLPYDIVPFYRDWIKDTFENKPYFEKHITSITLFYIVKMLLLHPLIVGRFFLMKLGVHINT